MDDLVDEKLMRRTFRLAKLSKNRGNGAFGALLSEGKVVLCEGENTTDESRGDPTCHAEMNVLRQAVKEYDKAEMARMTLYCSTEPCPMCAGAAYFCGVGRIVYGCGVTDVFSLTGRGLNIGCRAVLESGGGRDVKITGPILREEGLALHHK